MKKTLMALCLSAATAVGSASTAAEYIEGIGWMFGDVRVANPFDRATWYDSMENMDHEGSVTMAINFADPDFWLMIPNPKKHSKMHAAFTNPETWGQFTKPATYAKMTDRKILAKWLEKDTYAILGEPQTYAYWIQPGAFAHLVRVENYAQLFDKAAYSNLWATVKENFEHEYASHIAKYYAHLLAEKLKSDG